MDQMIGATPDDIIIENSGNQAPRSERNRSQQSGSPVPQMHLSDSESEIQAASGSGARSESMVQFDDSESYPIRGSIINSLHGLCDRFYSLRDHVEQVDQVINQGNELARHAELLPETSRLRRKLISYKETLDNFHASRNHVDRLSTESENFSELYKSIERYAEARREARETLRVRANSTELNLQENIVLQKSNPRILEEPSYLHKSLNFQVTKHASLAGVAGVADDIASFGTIPVAAIGGTVVAAALRAPVASAALRFSDGYHGAMLMGAAAAVKQGIATSMTAYRFLLGHDFESAVTNPASEYAIARKNLIADANFGKPWVETFEDWARRPDALDLNRTHTIATELRSTMPLEYRIFVAGETDFRNWVPDASAIEEAALLKNVDIRQTDHAGIVALIRVPEKVPDEIKELDNFCRAQPHPHLINKAEYTYGIIAQQSKTIAAILAHVNHPGYANAFERQVKLRMRDYVYPRQASDAGLCL